MRGAAFHSYETWYSRSTNNLAAWSAFSADERALISTNLNLGTRVYDLERSLKDAPTPEEKRVVMNGAEMREVFSICLARPKRTDATSCEIIILR